MAITVHGARLPTFDSSEISLKILSEKKNLLAYVSIGLKVVAIEKSLYGVWCFGDIRIPVGACSGK